MASSGGYVSAQKNGLAIIITNDYKETNLQYLTGAHNDGDKMERVFVNLGYDICRWKNYTSHRLHESLRQIISDIGHSNYGCIVVIFSGHGTADVDKKRTYFFAQDYECQKFPVHEMLNYFMPKFSPAIATTPKVFLIDSCLGDTDTYKEAVIVPKSGCAPDFRTEAPITEKGGQLIPTIDVPPEGNFILAYSTSIGYRSYEREHGGIWLNCLGNKIQEKAHCDSVMNILTGVNGDLLQMYQQKTFRRAMTQPSLIGQSHGTVYFMPQQQSLGAMADFMPQQQSLGAMADFVPQQQSQGAMADFVPQQQSQGAMADFVPQQSQRTMADFMPQQSQGAMPYFVPQQSQRTMAVHNGTLPAAEHESSSLNVSMRVMSIHESPSTAQTFSPPISCQTHLNNMQQARRISELRYDDIQNSMGKFLAKVTFKLSVTNKTLSFKSDPKVHLKEAREEAAKIAYKHLAILDAPVRGQTPKSALTRQGSSPQQLPVKKQSYNTPVQILKMACESARYKYDLEEVLIRDTLKFQYKVIVRDSTGILCEEVGSPQASKKEAKHNAASKANARLGFS